MSYNGGVNFGLLADYDSMDDVDVIADGIETPSRSSSTRREPQAETAVEAERPRADSYPRSRVYLGQ